MNAGKLFPSKWLTAADLEDEDMVVTIKSLETESIGQKGDEEDKPVLYFRELAKGLVLNKTNVTTIAKLLGDETNDWYGKKITLFPTQVDFQGKQVDAIRVKSKLPKEKPVRAGEPELATEPPY